MTMSEAARVNRIIAEFEGWQRITSSRQLLSDPPIPIYEGYPPKIDLEVLDRGGYGLQAGPCDIPDYWNSADAILPVVERICRERGMFIEFMYDGERTDPQWCLVIGVEMMDVKHKSLSTAAALACAAVIEAKAERTEP